MTVKTDLIGKNEIFRLFALGQATRLPVLLVGPKGVAKTQTCLDYIRARVAADTGVEITRTEAVLSDATFLHEVNRQSRAGEITGRVNVGKLVTDKEFELVTPIATAQYVLINEIDKSGGAVRDALLSILAEKTLFNGETKIPCNWEFFVGTCNEIPSDEADNHFWDRWPIKSKVNRVSQSDMVGILQTGLSESSLAVNVPTPEEIEAVTIPVNKLEKFVEVAYRLTSDRTLTKAPVIIKAISLIWGTSINEACVKAAEIMFGKDASTTLSQLLMSNEMKTVLKKIQQVGFAASRQEADKILEDAIQLSMKYHAEGLLSDEDLDEIGRSGELQLSNTNQSDTDVSVKEAA